MTAKPSKIERLRIATPCPMSWAQMTGDDRVRFCDQCHLNVYNISELTRIEAEALIAASEGRLCARLFRRADGTILTKDCPVGLRALRRRVAKRTAAIFAGMVSLTAVVFGQHSPAKKGKELCTPQIRITRKDVSSDKAASVLTGTVLDPYGAVVPGARVTIISEPINIQTTFTNDEGEFVFAGLELGKYSLNIKALGFKDFVLRNFAIERNKLINLDMILLLDGNTEVIGLFMGEPSLIDTPSGTTIINEQIIRRLPIQN